MTLVQEKAFRGESNDRKPSGAAHQASDWKGLHDQVLKIALNKAPTCALSYKLGSGKPWESGIRLLPRGLHVRQQPYSSDERAQMLKVTKNLRQLVQTILCERSLTSRPHNLWVQASRSLWKESVRQHSQPSSAYQSIIAAIRSSESIVQLQDNWDGEAAQGYQRVTWERATEFLRKQARFAEEIGYEIGVPRISPADEGSIDIFWKSESRELLVNVPADPQDITTYYGQNSRGDTISGSISTEATRPELILWLAKTPAT